MRSAPEECSRMRRGARSGGQPPPSNRVSSAVAGWAPGRRRAGSLDLRHPDGEAVAAPGDGLDTAGVGSPLVEDPAERCDLRVQIAVLDGRRRPYGGHELVPRYEVSCSSDQHVEDLKGARADRDRYEFTGSVAPAQRAGLPIEPKALEQEEVTANTRVHASPRPECSNFYRNL
jgi:hypothetical protein